MNAQKNSIIQTVPAAERLRKVPDFDPLKYLTRVTSKRTGEKVLKLDLAYKRLWFRLAHPNGKMLFYPMRITDQMAIFEAQIFFDRNDPAPMTNFTSTKFAKEVGSQYIQAAQDEALNEALDNAGFGIQLCDLVELRRDTGYGSEIPLSQMESPAAAVNAGELPANKLQPEDRRETELPVLESAPSVQSPVVQSQAVTQPVEANTEPAPSKTAPVADEGMQTTESVSAPATEQPAATVEAKIESGETGSMLQMLGTMTGMQTEGANADASDTDAQTHTGETHTADEEASTAVTYTDDMTVEEICARMTAEEARNVVVTFGTCEGWTLAQVLDRRPSSLRFYVYGSGDAGNVLKAAATILLNDMSQRKVG